MRDNNDSGYKSTCANEEIVDGTGSPRTGQLAHELSTKGFWVGGPGLGRIWPGLAGSGWPDSPKLAGAAADRRRERKEKRRGRKGRKKRKIEGKRDPGEEEKKERKRKRIRVLGFSEVEIRLYSVSSFSF